MGRHRRRRSSCQAVLRRRCRIPLQLQIRLAHGDWPACTTKFKLLVLGQRFLGHDGRIVVGSVGQVAAPINVPPVSGWRRFVVRGVLDVKHWLRRLLGVAGGLGLGSSNVCGSCHCHRQQVFVSRPDPPFRRPDDPGRGGRGSVGTEAASGSTRIRLGFSSCRAQHLTAVVPLDVIGLLGNDGPTADWIGSHGQHRPGAAVVEMMIWDLVSSGLSSGTGQEGLVFTEQSLLVRRRRQGLQEQQPQFKVKGGQVKSCPCLI